MLSDLIKEAARKCAAENQAGVLFGTVAAESPLEIRVEDRFSVQGQRLILPDHLKKREQEIRFGEETQTVLHSPGLKTGDKVALVRAGEFFLVAGTVGS